MDKEINKVDVSIKWPFKWTLVGSSGSGKTNFALNIIKKSPSLFDKKPDRVIIIYKVFQDIYNSFNDFFPTTMYTDEECDFEELTKSNKENLLVICDDLYFSKKLDEISEYFLIKGRHRNTSWIVLTQSIFNQPALKNISRNSTHMTLFKNVRLNEPHILFSQLRPRSSKVLQDIYAEATEEPYGYLDIDLSQTCSDKLRYKTNIFDAVVKVFVIMSETSFKTMYLVNKSFLDENQNFKLSIRNKDICKEGMNVTVKPIRKRKSKKINLGRAAGDDSDDIDDSGNGGQNDRDEKDEQMSNGLYGYDGTYLKGDDRKSDDYIYEESNLQNEHYKPFTKEKANLKRNRQDFFDTDQNPKVFKRFHPEPAIESHSEAETDQNPTRTCKNSKCNQIHENDKNSISDNFQSNDLATPSRATFKNHKRIGRKIKKIYKPYKYQKHFKNRHSISSSNTTPRKNKKNDDDDDEEENNKEKQLGNNKRIRIEDESGDQWISGLKSRLNERRVQFKRKKDTIGYRVQPDDAFKSIIQPSDFRFLDPVTSSELLGKWKPLKELKEKQSKNKRFKPYRSFSVSREPNI